MDKITIRKLLESEVELYRELRLLSLTTDPDYFHLKLSEAMEKSTNFFLEEMTDPEFGCIGAFTGGSLTGMLTLKRIDLSSGQFFSLYVRPQNRGEGLGSALVHHYLYSAKDAGLSRIILSVMRQNPALHLYETLGFKESGVVPGSLEEVMMERGL